MKIVMKEYDLWHFKQKDIYTWEEVVEGIKELQDYITTLENANSELEDRLLNTGYDYKADEEDRQLHQWQEEINSKKEIEW